MKLESLQVKKQSLPTIERNGNLSRRPRKASENLYSDPINAQNESNNDQNNLTISKKEEKSLQQSSKVILENIQTSSRNNGSMKIHIEKSVAQIRTKIIERNRTSKADRMKGAVDTYMTYVQNPTSIILGTNTTRSGNPQNVVSQSRKLHRAIRKHNDPEELRQFLSNQIKFQFDQRHEEIISKYQKIKEQSGQQYRRFKYNSVEVQPPADISKDERTQIQLPEIKQITRNVYGLSSIGIASVQKNYQTLNVEPSSQIETSKRQSQSFINNDLPKDEKQLTIVTDSKVVFNTLKRKKRKKQGSVLSDIYQKDASPTHKHQDLSLKPKKLSKLNDEKSQQRDPLKKNSEVETGKSKKKHHITKENFFLGSQIASRQQKNKKVLENEFQDPKIQKKLMLIQRHNEGLISLVNVSKICSQVMTPPPEPIDQPLELLNPELVVAQKPGDLLVPPKTKKSKNGNDTTTKILKESQSLDVLHTQRLFKPKQSSPINQEKSQDVNKSQKIKMERSSSALQLKLYRPYLKTDSIKKKAKREKNALQKQLKQEKKEEILSMKKKFKELMGFNVSSQIEKIENDLEMLHQLYAEKSSKKKKKVLQIEVSQLTQNEAKVDIQSGKKGKVAFNLSKNTVI